jgi:hypothetical protein
MRARSGNVTPSIYWLGLALFGPLSAGGAALDRAPKPRPGPIATPSSAASQTAGDRPSSVPSLATPRHGVPCTTHHATPCTSSNRTRVLF